MPPIILHQYDSSPFSEKVRICLGIKNAEWFAVDQPVIMPKPDLVPLTGGYRRIPVMQIGADIYCDSVLIVEEIERRLPGPSLFPGGVTGLATALQYWSDREFFQAAVAVIFGGLGDKVDPAFIKDREALSGRPFDTGAMQAAIPYMREQLQAHAGLIDRQLEDGRLFLGGGEPGAADAVAYYNLWFVKAHYPPAASAFAAYQRLEAWMDRVASLGHGTRREMSREEALVIARDKQPDQAVGGEHPLIGRTVAVSAADYGRDPVVGQLIGMEANRVSLLRSNPSLGPTAVHFPRIGYAVTPA